jgi:hypothetical protein
MAKNKNIFISISFIYIWIGLILGISFLEAWLKFQVPGVSLQVGLSIGKLVYSVLNIIEWIFAIIIVIILFLNVLTKKVHKNGWIIAIIISLLIQSVWLLPVLNNRVELYVQGVNPAPSNVHIYYVVFEIVKLVSLFLLGKNLINKIIK